MFPCKAVIECIYLFPLHVFCFVIIYGTVNKSVLWYREIGELWVNRDVEMSKVVRMWRDIKKIKRRELLLTFLHFCCSFSPHYHTASDTQTLQYDHDHVEKCRDNVIVCWSQVWYYISKHNNSYIKEEYDNRTIRRTVNAHLFTF